MDSVDVEDVSAEEAKKAGTADFIIAVESQRAIKVCCIPVCYFKYNFLLKLAVYNGHQHVTNPSYI